MKKESSCLLLAFLIFAALFSLIYGYFELGGNEMKICEKVFSIIICGLFICLFAVAFIYLIFFSEKNSEPQITFDNNALFEKEEEKLYMFDGQKKIDDKKKCHLYWKKSSDI